MIKKLLLFFTIPLVLVSFFVLKPIFSPSTGAPPYGETEDSIPDMDPYSWLRNWVRPEGPANVALQAGHWKAAEAPDELERLRKNTGSSGGGHAEWEVNLAIAEETKKLLEAQGVTVEILPTTIPEDYWADVFVSIHADGNTVTSKSGYKIAAPWRDFSGKANNLVTALDATYATASGLPKDDNVTRNMRGYYAFSWWRYDHAIHPMTTAAIIETGFLTSPNDRKFIVSNPQKAAKAISDGIINYLQEEKLLTD